MSEDGTIEVKLTDALIAMALVIQDIEVLLADNQEAKLEAMDLVRLGLQEVLDEAKKRKGE